MKVVFAEDDDPKARNVEQFVTGLLEDANVERTKSVRSTLELLDCGGIDLLLLDMSLPTFDVSKTEGGGRAQSAGGVEVLDSMHFAGMDTPTIVITQHPAFELHGKTVNLEGLGELLTKSYPGCFKGIVQYNNISGAWRASLEAAIENVLRIRR